MTAELGSDPLEVTKAKVRHWARWYRWSVENGFPPHSWEGRAILRGGSAPRPQDAAHPMPSNETAEEVEGAMQLMDDLLKHALVERHVKRRINRDAAKRCHCSVAGFKERTNGWCRVRRLRCRRRGGPKRGMSRVFGLECVALAVSRLLEKRQDFVCVEGTIVNSHVASPPLKWRYPSSWDPRLSGRLFAAIWKFAVFVDSGCPLMNIDIVVPS